jgi:hypothetical protein
MWKSLQGDTIVTLSVVDTMAGIMAYRTFDPDKRTRLIFEPWEE